MILVLVVSLKFGTVAIMAIAYNKSGQTINTFFLDKRQSIAFAGRINTPMLMRIINHWQELEASKSRASIVTLYDSLERVGGS